MKLLPREIEKLELHQAGFLAQKRLARGIRLNYTEAVALISTQILEFIRDGEKSVAELMDIGRQLLGRRQVLPAVVHLLYTVQVEGTFRDGTKLVTVHEPISSENGNLQLALHGSFLPVPSLDIFPEAHEEVNPGEIKYGDGSIIMNHGRKAVVLKVVNNGDRPVQVGSHYHFIEVNPLLVFDRRKALGMRLNIPAGTAVRFEPGERKSVVLVNIGGNKVIRGGNGIVDGPVDDVNWTVLMETMERRGFGHVEDTDAIEGIVGPYLKAEDSLSPQNLSEFTVLDVELELTYHFSEIMDLVDKLLVFIFSHLNDRCVSHLEAVNKQYPFGPLQFFQKTKRLSFVQGIKLLEESGVEVSDPLGDLSSELKRRLGQIVFEKYGTDLYMLYHCPSIARPFVVMPCENDDRYCNSFDVFLRGEEIISGGQHVHDADFLEKRATDCKIDAQDISPYIDSFRCGTPLHGGFRMVLERVAMLFCGLN